MSKAFITDYVINPDLEREILGSDLADQQSAAIEVLLVWHDHVSAEYIDRFPNLKGIVRYGVGFDNIDLGYARAKNINVCNTPDYGTDEVSDTALAMIMNIARGVSRYDFICRDSGDSWQEQVIGSLKRTSATTLGVVGAGRIGGSIILKANALRFRTLFFDPYIPTGSEKVLNAGRAESLEELLAHSDIVSINTPLTSETRGMVNQQFLLKMREGASLINTARGPILSDIDILYDSLKSDRLNAVALDVLPDEPPIDSKLIRAWRNREPWLDGRLVINPHTAYFSQQAFQEMRKKAAINAKCILDGGIPKNIVNIN